MWMRRHAGALWDILACFSSEGSLQGVDTCGSLAQDILKNAEPSLHMGVNRVLKLELGLELLEIDGGLATGDDSRANLAFLLETLDIQGGH